MNDIPNLDKLWELSMKDGEVTISSEDLSWLIKVAMEKERQEAVFNEYKVVFDRALERAKNS